MADVSFNAAEVMKNLQGADFPLDKEGVIGVARNNGASQEVMGLLEELPEHEYLTPAAVMEELGGH